MNRKLLNFLATLILALLLSNILPWWSVMIAAFIAALFLPLKKTAVFFVPFLSILLFWAVNSFILSIANDFTLANRVAMLLPLGGNPYLLMLVTGIVGGLAAGVAAVFGRQLAFIIQNG